MKMSELNYRSRGKGSENINPSSSFEYSIPLGETSEQDINVTYTLTRHMYISPREIQSRDWRFHVARPAPRNPRSRATYAQCGALCAPVSLRPLDHPFCPSPFRPLTLARPVVVRCGIEEPASKHPRRIYFMNARRMSETRRDSGRWS